MIKELVYTGFQPHLTLGTWFYSNNSISIEFDYENFEINQNGLDNSIASGLSARENGSSLPLEYLILCFFGVKFSTNNNLKYFLLVSNTIWLVAFVLNSILDLPVLRTFQPWRISGICIFVSTIIIFSKIIRNLNFKLPNFLIFTFLLLAISIITPNKGEIYKYDDLGKMDINISQNLFVDPALRHFSLNSGGRPIFVSENFPYSDNGILEWNSRYSLNEEIFNSKIV